MKKILMSCALALVLFACGNSGSNTNTTDTTTNTLNTGTDTLSSDTSMSNRTPLNTDTGGMRSDSPKKNY